ncbi:alpha/beta hydrolase [Sutcliffiella deserti]|uniref:alpha/beta hydrolase n=1 Tax=Sutcliffiella deserti TaxID=2875501 RepID=UPI001CC155C3|nr:alpha/beta fold hydrolase [Sutcliffiella deserti]
MLEQFKVHIKTLNRERMIRVYLPKGYEQSDRRFPVLYMHDGQNLFNDEDANFGVSWGIPDFLDESDIQVIVVGIDSNQEGMKRLDEYSPWKSEVFSDWGVLGGEGEKYTEFIVKELKPLIDSSYRTIPEETSMAGSSMGGFISTYAACVYPHIFKRIASVSSAYWFNQNELENLIKNSDLTSIERFYMDIGTNEVTESITPERYVESSKKVHAILQEKLKDLRFDIVDGAIHNEEAWRTRVQGIFLFLFK